MGVSEGFQAISALHSICSFSRNTGMSVKGKDGIRKGEGSAERLEYRSLAVLLPLANLT